MNTAWKYTILLVSTYDYRHFISMVNTKILGIKQNIIHASRKLFWSSQETPKLSYCLISYVISRDEKLKKET